MIVFRITVKVAYMELKTPDVVRKRVAIFGAGDGGIIAKRTIDRDSRSGMKVVAFFDDDAKKSGMKLEGADIYQTARLREFMAAGKIDQVVIAAPSISKQRKNAIIEEALAAGIQISDMPPSGQWIGGELSVRQFRDVKIEDLLGRDSIQLDTEEVRRTIHQKIVLVTGAAGSIGSELVRQILVFKPAKLILLDQAETPLFELESELQLSETEGSFEVVIGDIRQRERMRRMMDHFRPEVVFHAAAYKHVPLMENNPSEAILTNVLGTRVMADLSVEFGVKTFILISTDKAVNPTNVMGASKRVAEMYVQALSQEKRTSFITTRFGNVLGSNGSVIPIFRKQIQRGGPVTVTHPEVTRFFMTIPEAAQLVLQAASMGSGGEIFAFDMGEQVRIVDLAEKMIRLSGLEPGVDIEIQITGLRPGEKLYEEVLNEKEKTKPTPHQKILIAEVRTYPLQEVQKDINELIDLFDTQNNDRIVAHLKKMVPEFVSNNSEFERLDQSK
jgi:FlaA1/EpsC-like NDP-sugar epimerase